MASKNLHNGNQSQYDVDRLYRYNGSDFMLIQNYAFNPVFNPSLSVEK